MSITFTTEPLGLCKYFGETNFETGRVIMTENKTASHLPDAGNVKSAGAQIGCERCGPHF